jgi:uncharacterized Ntn-hydrolase superfamily protein
MGVSRWRTLALPPPQPSPLQGEGVNTAARWATNVIELNTFSIVARCERTGEFGVAVATAVPAVGSMCPYVVAGVGAVSTQSWVNPYLAIDALAAMQGGASAQQALADVLANDPEADLRQIGVIGAQGDGIAWTGAGCTPWQGHLVGPDFAIQGNMLTGEATLTAMRQAFLADPKAELAERLMGALEAGDAAGGDKRGKQSAALRVSADEAYASVDLRVDEHASPVAELRRVLEVARRQLLPFVRGMPRRHGTPRALGADVMQMLLRPPAQRGRP